jgi:hypothetical protein
MPALLKRALLQSCAVALIIGLSACATGVSTSGYKGEAKGVVQTIKDLQSDVTAGDQKKVCRNDLASSVVARLSSSRGGCQQAIKDQLAEIASFEVDVHSVQVTQPGKTATARVKSKYSGKNRTTAVSLVKERGRWKIAKLS